MSDAGTRGTPPDVARILAQILMKPQQNAPLISPRAPMPAQAPSPSAGWQGEGSLGGSLNDATAKLTGPAKPPVLPQQAAPPQATPLAMAPPQGGAVNPADPFGAPLLPTQQINSAPGMQPARPDVLEALRQIFAKRGDQPTEDWRSAMDQAQWARQGQ